jgi:hypothetical protein
MFDVLGMDAGNTKPVVSRGLWTGTQVVPRDPDVPLGPLYHDDSNSISNW